MEVAEGYKDTKIGKIPKDWEVYKFGDVFEFIKTSSHSKAQMTLDETESDIFNVHYGAIHTTYREQLLNFDKYNVPRITDDSKLPTTNQYLKEGDVVIVDASEDAGGMGECVEINNIGQRKVIGGLHTFAVRDKNGLFAKGFAGYIFKNSISRNKLIGVSNISKVYGVSKGNIVSVPLIIPPLPEQKKIAEILSTLDEQISTTQAIIDKSKELKKGLMQKLFSEGIGHTEFKDTKIGRIPKDWEVKTFKKLVKINQGLQIAISKRLTEKKDGAHFYITNEFLKSNSKFTFYVKNPNESVMCEESDILMTRTGNTGQVVTNVRGVFHNNFFKIKYDNDITHKDFLFYYLTNKRTQKKILSLAGTSTIPDLNHSDFYSILMPTPKIEEQQKIANILSEADAKIEKEEQEKAKLEELKKGLMQQLLTGKKRVKV